MAIVGPTRDHEQIKQWADSKSIMPCNLEPNRIDAEPATMCLLHKETVASTPMAKPMPWAEFFKRFDELGLTLVYDEANAYNELLQVEDKVIPPAYRNCHPATTEPNEKDPGHVPRGSLHPCWWLPYPLTNTQLPYPHGS